MATDPYSIGLSELLADGAWARSLARALVGDHDGCEITQEVLRKALTKPPTGDGSIRAYWARALSWEASNLRRSRARRQQRENAAARSEGSVPDPALVVEQLEQRELLAQCLLTLPEDLRYVLVLRYERGLNASEIGDHLGVSPSTIRDRLTRGRELLRARLLRHDPEWRRALLPLAFPALPAPPVAAPLTISILTMKMKTLVVVLLLLVPAILWGVWQMGPDNSGETKGVVVTSSEAEVPGESLAEGELQTRTSVIETVPQAAPAPNSVSAPAVVDGKDASSDLHVLARLIDEDGQPLPRAQLKLWLPPAGGPEVILKPDAQGRIDDWVTSDLIVEGKHMQWDASDGPGRHKTGVCSSETGHTLQLGDIRLDLVSRFRGLVVDDEGRPLSGIHTVYRFDDPRNPFAVERWLGGPKTDNTGHYETRSFSQGRVYLRVAPLGWSAAPVSAMLVPGGEAELPNLVCTPKALRGVARANFLTIGGEPVAPGVVLVRSGTHLQRPETMSPRSEIGLGYLSDRNMVEILAMSFEEGVWGHCMFPPSEAYPRKTVILKPMVPLRLQALDADGESVSIALVRILDRRWRRVLAERVGFDLELLADGSVELLVPDRALIIEVGVGRTPAPERIEFDSPPAGAIQLQVAEPFPVFGGVVTFEGRPIEGASVSLHRGAQPGTLHGMGNLPMRFDGMPAHPSVMTTSAGAFSLPWSLEVPAMLLVQAPGLPDRTVELLKVPCDEPLQIELEAAGRIEGRVRYDDGSEVAGMHLALMRGALDARTVQVAADGTFAFENVAPDTWFFEPSRTEVPLRKIPGAWSGQGEPWDPSGLNSCQVAGGKTTIANFVLKKPRSFQVAGRIRVDGVPMHGWSVDVYSDATHGPVFKTLTNDMGQFELDLWGAGPFRWSAYPRTGGVTIQRNIESEAQDLNWDLDLYLAQLEFEVGTYLDRASYWVDLGRGFEANGHGPPPRSSAKYTLQVPAGIVRLRTSTRLGQPPLADPGPYDLTAGETWRIRLP